MLIKNDAPVGVLWNVKLILYEKFYCSFNMSRDMENILKIKLLKLKYD